MSYTMILLDAMAAANYGICDLDELIADIEEENNQ